MKKGPVVIKDELKTLSEHGLEGRLNEKRLTGNVTFARKIRRLYEVV